MPLCPALQFFLRRLKNAYQPFTLFLCFAASLGASPTNHFIKLAAKGCSNFFGSYGSLALNLEINWGSMSEYSLICGAMQQLVLTTTTCRKPGIPFYGNVALKTSRRPGSLTFGFCHNLTVGHDFQHVERNQTLGFGIEMNTPGCGGNLYRTPYIVFLYPKRNQRSIGREGTASSNSFNPGRAAAVRRFSCCREPCRYSLCR
jgi:hypothetical protein